MGRALAHREEGPRAPPHILRHATTYLPALFRTRAEARAWIEEHYGYIRTRPDLLRHPHYWRLPRPVRVTVTVDPPTR